MARTRKINQDLVTKAQTLAAQAKGIKELRMAQAILLPALADMTLEQTATALGVGRATVARLQTHFRQQKETDHSVRRSWGGRRRALLSMEEEKAFIAAWQAQAERGELVVLRPLRVALDKKLGRHVKPSVVYRMLARHRWRKVAPDTRHPKADQSLQAEWKKKHFPKSWQPF